MEYAELRKFRKRMSEGSGSSRVTEALLEMYWREGLSVDAAFAQYTKTRFGTDIENAERMCDKIVKTARENLRMEKYNAQKTADLLKAVYEFVEQTQRCFCESICQRERYQDSPCPVKQLVEFINWLEKELDVLCQAPKRNGSVDGNRDESIQTDRNGNIVPVKNQSPKQRIDGTAALLDCYVGLYEHYNEFTGAI